MVPRPAYLFLGAIGPLRTRLAFLKLDLRRVGGRAGTAVPQGAVCEPPNPPQIFPQFFLPNPFMSHSAAPLHPSY